MPGPDVVCVAILVVTMTVAFAIGSLLVKLLIYSNVHGFDDNSIEILDDLRESRSGGFAGALIQRSVTCERRSVHATTTEQRPRHVLRRTSVPGRNDRLI